MVTAIKDAGEWLQAANCRLRGFLLNEVAQVPRPGLYSYRFFPQGGQVHIHLRIEEMGNGVLFADATDVIHLNQTAAEMAKMALDDVPLSTAQKIFIRRHGRAYRDQILRESKQIYDMIGAFRNPGSGCLTCSVNGLERAALFSSRANAPYKADLALTYGCNNHCAHCYNEPDRFAMPSLPLEQWQAVIDKLFRVGVPHIIFTGGEATLNPDLLTLVSYADHLGLVTGLNSNGRRLAKQSYADSLAEAGLNHIQITLGSSRPDLHNAIMSANAFDQTVHGIQNAMRAGIHTITNTTLMRANMGHVDEIITFLFDLGIRTFAMNGMIYSGGGLQDPNAIPENELAPLLVRVRDLAQDLGMRFLWYTPTEYCRMSPVELEIGAKRCNAGEYSICIEPNGDVLPCQSFYVSAGNILRDDWADIWQGQLFRSFRDRERHPKLSGLPEKCWDCPDLPLCGGGCRIEREARAGMKTSGSNGGDCGSCTTSAKHSQQVAFTGGYIPTPGSIVSKSRSSGNGAALIGTREIAILPARKHEDLK